MNLLKYMVFLTFLEVITNFIFFTRRDQDKKKCSCLIPLLERQEQKRAGTSLYLLFINL